MEKTKQYINELAGHGFFEAIGDGLSIQNTDYKIIYQNNVHKSLIGNHIGEYCYKAYEKRKDICEGCPLAKSFEDGKIHKAERSTLTDKGTLYVEITASSLKDSSGNIIAGIEIARDITKRKKAEHKLKRSEKELMESQKVALIGSWDWDILNNRITWSEELFNRFGVSPKEFEATFEAFLSMVHPDDREHLDKEVKRSVRDKAPYHIDVRIINPDGRRWIMEARGVVTCDESGNPVRMGGTAQDITERKKLEEQFHHSQKLESVGQLAAGVAHGFNNILYVIVNYCYVLLDELENEEQRLHVRQILDSAKKAARLTSELLSFGRNKELISHSVKIHEIIKGVIKIVSDMIGEHIHIKTVLTDDNLIIMGNRDKIEEALMNLVTNALDAMPEGGTLTIETSQVEIDKDYITVHGFGEPGEYTLVSITDTGIGMDEKARERIFEPFYTTKDVGKGTGLGLSIVYGIIKQHNGYINVYSEPEKGTSFKILLPLIGEKAMEEES